MDISPCSHSYCSSQSPRLLKLLQNCPWSGLCIILYFYISQSQSGQLLDLICCVPGTKIIHYHYFFLNWTEQFGNSPSFYLSELLIELSDTEGKILSVNLRSIIVNSHGENQFRDLLTASLRIWQEPCILSEVILRNDVYMTRRNFKGQHRNYIIRQITKYEFTSNWNCSFLKAKTSGWGFWTFGRGQISPLAHGVWSKVTIGSMVKSHNRLVTANRMVTPHILVTIYLNWSKHLSLLNPGSRTVMLCKDA